VNHTWPALFLRAPADGSEPEFRVAVPEQRLRDDVSGESEAGLLPTMRKLMAAIEANKTAGGRAVLLSTEQLVPQPNGRGVRDACLNNYTFVPMVNPFVNASTQGGCGFGTRDCRYGTSPMDTPFGEDRFYVVVRRLIVLSHLRSGGELHYFHFRSVLRWACGMRRSATHRTRA
jgi:hypothetical protein